MRNQPKPKTSTEVKPSIETNAKSQPRPATYAQVLKGSGKPKASYEFTPFMVANANFQPSMVVNADSQPKPVSYAQVLKGDG